MKKHYKILHLWKIASHQHVNSIQWYLSSNENQLFCTHTNSVLPWKTRFMISVSHISMVISDFMCWRWQITKSISKHIKVEKKLEFFLKYFFLFFFSAGSKQHMFCITSLRSNIRKPLLILDVKRYKFRFYNIFYKKIFLKYVKTYFHLMA